MKMHINGKYSELQPFIRELPSLFSTFGDVLYEGRNTIKVFKVNDMLINVKSFKNPIFINRVVYRFFRKSKAERSFNYALRLLDRNVNTPEPVAYVEILENGLFTRSYYVSVHEIVDGTMKDIYHQSADESRDLVKAFTLFTARLHDKGIFHKDYSPGNILYRKNVAGYEFLLVDLNRIKFKRMNIFDSCRSFCKIRIDVNMQNFIAKEYAKVRKFNKNICQALINYYNRLFWKKYLVRHPDNN